MLNPTAACTFQAQPSSTPTSALPTPAVLKHVVDVHCHPTDSPIRPEAISALPITICAMSTRPADQPLVRDLAAGHPDKVVPCFGYHPWFTHWITLKPCMNKKEHYRALFMPSPEHTAAFDRLLSVLPEPTPLSNILAELQHNLLSFPRAMLGEVGLDRSARVAFEYTADPRELTPFSIPFDHQNAILEAQLDVAVALRRNVSMHSVKSSKATLELLERMSAKHGEHWDAISVDLHSCGLSSQMWMAIEKKYSNVFLSLSTAINSRSPNHRSLIAACSPHRILVESDFHTIDACAERTWDMLLTVAEIKEWRVEDIGWDDGGDDEKQKQWGAVRRLEANWRAFEKGGHVSARKGKRKNGEEKAGTDCDSSKGTSSAACP